MSRVRELPDVEEARALQNRQRLELDFELLEALLLAVADIPALLVEQIGYLGPLREVHYAFPLLLVMRVGASRYNAGSIRDELRHAECRQRIRTWATILTFVRVQLHRIVCEEPNEIFCRVDIITGGTLDTTELLYHPVASAIRLGNQYSPHVYPASPH